MAAERNAQYQTKCAQALIEPPWPFWELDTNIIHIWQMTSRQNQLRNVRKVMHVTGRGAGVQSHSGVYPAVRWASLPLSPSPDQHSCQDLPFSIKAHSFLISSDIFVTSDFPVSIPKFSAGIPRSLAIVSCLSFSSISVPYPHCAAVCLSLWRREWADIRLFTQIGQGQTKETGSAMASVMRQWVCWGSDWSVGDGYT